MSQMGTAAVQGGLVARRAEREVAVGGSGGAGSQTTSNDLENNPAHAPSLLDKQLFLGQSNKVYIVDSAFLAFVIEATELTPARRD